MLHASSRFFGSFIIYCYSHEESDKIQVKKNEIIHNMLATSYVPPLMGIRKKT